MIFYCPENLSVKRIWQISLEINLSDIPMAFHMCQNPLQIQAKMCLPIIQPKVVRLIPVPDAYFLAHILQAG